jgi:UDP-glucose 6-dehydrogenase
MKVRIDFVTNSSSSSFIVARKSELTEAQKDAIIKFVENEFLGEKIISPDNTEDEISEIIENESLDEESVRQALSEGKNIYQGYVVFESSGYGMTDLFQDFWAEFAKADSKNFTQIDTELEG